MAFEFANHVLGAPNPPDVLLGELVDLYLAELALVDVSNHSDALQFANCFLAGGLPLFQVLPCFFLVFLMGLFLLRVILFVDVSEDLFTHRKHEPLSISFISNCRHQCFRRSRRYWLGLLLLLEWRENRGWSGRLLLGLSHHLVWL